MKHKGKLSIGRYSGDESGISIELQDDSSRVRVVRIEMTPEAFGNAVTGGSFQECDFELTRPDLVGMKAEYKTEMVPFLAYGTKDADRKEAVAPFEVDGWKADLDDLGNMHRWASEEKGFKVGFRRHVK